MDITMLAQECAPGMQPPTIEAIVAVESSFNPNAIGVADGYLQRQPTDKAEAISTALSLAANDRYYSVGLAQINKSNIERFALTIESVFDRCTHLRLKAQILTECFVRHSDSVTEPQSASRDAFSCYYRGNYPRGHTTVKSETRYVQRV